MILKQVLGDVRAVALGKTPSPVEVTGGREVLAFLGKGRRFRRVPPGRFAAALSTLYIGLAGEAWTARLARMGVRLPEEGEWVCLHLGPEGSAFLLASRPSFLYAAWRFLLDRLLDEDAARFRPTYSDFVCSKPEPLSFDQTLMNSRSGASRIRFVMSSA